MMSTIALNKVANKIRGSRLIGDCEFARVSIDTRSINAGDLFVAIKGENYDAHDFLNQVVEKQAAAVVVEKEMDNFPLPQLVVEDSVQALGDIARINRLEFDGPLIAITGSGGKTTVKNMLHNILQQCGKAYATKGNLNNHIGVPLTLFDLSSEHEYAVVEMGASGPGEIAYLTDIAKPTVAVITNALHAHVAGFGSVEGVARAKGEIFAGLGQDGIAILNMDDAFVDTWLEIVDKRKKYTFSVAGKHADFVARDIVEHANGCCEFVLVTPETSMPISLSVLGKQNVANALAAAACAYAVGAKADAIRQGLEATQAFKGRMQVRQGKNKSRVIDDSYNANPEAVKAAVDYLSNQQGKTILVLGDLGELGRDEIQYHKGLGYYAKSAGISQLLTKGDLTKHCQEAFGEGAQHFDSFEQLNNYINSILDADSVVLVKGSRLSHMENVVSALTDDGEA